MGLTEEEEIRFVFFLVEWKAEWRFCRCWVGEGRIWAEGGRNRPSDRGTLEIRVNRIEEKPLGLPSIR